MKAKLLKKLRKKYFKKFFIVFNRDYYIVKETVSSDSWTNYGKYQSLETARKAVLYAVNSMIENRILDLRCHSRKSRYCKYFW